MDGHSTILPVDDNLNHDFLERDLSNPPRDRPWLKCFKNGDGIRGNQNPMAIALNIITVIRHNQHCRGLAEVNPHWDDEKLYLEARSFAILKILY